MGGLCIDIEWLLAVLSGCVDKFVGTQVSLSWGWELGILGFGNQNAGPTFVLWLGDRMGFGFGGGWSDLEMENKICRTYRLKEMAALWGSWEVEFVILDWIGFSDPDCYAILC